MEREGALAILFSDIRGFTSYTAERGDREAYRLAKAFVGLVEEQVDRHDGRVIKTYGDGVMTTFPVIRQSVLCSVGMQKALSEHNQAHSEETISAGIGVNWGEPVQAESDLIGHSVNLAKRLADYAKGGQIIVSSEVKELAGEFEDLQYLDLGCRELKGLGQQQLYELIWRKEVARLSTKNDQMNLVLTKDNKFVMELSKEVEEKLQRAQEKLREAAEKRKGLSKVILHNVAKHMDKYLPQMIDKALYKAGIGLEHALDQVEATFEGDELTLKIKGHRGIKLSRKDIDIPKALDFIAKLKGLKSGGLLEGEAKQ